MEELKKIVQVNRNDIAQKLQIANICGVSAEIRIHNEQLNMQDLKLTFTKDLWIIPVTEILVASENLCLVSKKDIFNNALAKYQKLPQVNHKNQELNDLIMQFKNIIPQEDESSTNVVKNLKESNNLLGLKQPYLYFTEEQIKSLADDFATLIASALPTGNNNNDEEDSRSTIFFINSAVILTQRLGFPLEQIIANMLELEPNVKLFLERFK